MILVPRQLAEEAATDCVPTIAVCAVFAALSWIVICLRLWTKLRITKNLGWDDRLMLLAVVCIFTEPTLFKADLQQIFFTIYCGAVIDISTRVTATHSIVSFDDLLISITVWLFVLCGRPLANTGPQILTVAEVFYILSVMVLKLSLGVFFLRITIDFWHRMIIYTAVTISSIYSVVMFFFAVFQCGYYKNSLDFIIKRLGNKCASNSTTLGMTYTHAAVTTLTDWTFLFLPFLILRGSLMKRSEKWSVGSILGFAAMSVVTYAPSFLSFLTHITVAELRLSFASNTSMVLPCQRKLSSVRIPQFFTRTAS
jgi:hypothetical protein